MIFSTDAAGNWQLLNPPWTSLTEYSVEESLDRSAFEFIHPDERESMRSELHEILRSGKSVARRLRLLTRRGRTRWIDLSAAPSRDASGRIDGAVGTIRDVTAHQLRRALDDASRTLDRDVLDDRRISATLQRVCDDLATATTSPLVALTLADGRAGGPFVAPAGSAFHRTGQIVLPWDDLETVTGPIGNARRTRQTQTLSVTESSGPGTTHEATTPGTAHIAVIPLLTPTTVLGVLCVGAGDAEALDHDQLSALEAFAGRLSLALQLAEHQALLGLQGVNRKKSGELYVVTQNVTPLLDENQVLTHLVAAHDDVTTRRQAETRLEHMARHDGLTDLPNRTVFAQRLQAAIAQAESEGGCVGVLFVDLDRFKLINETFGHLVGDQLLREVAARLKSSVRDLDLVARFDGDEFTLVLPGCDIGVATLVAERVLASLGQPVRIGGHDLAITASIGIALSSPEARDADALLKRADMAMYQAKEVGRNGYAFFRGGLEVRPVPTFTIQSGLRRALANGELALHYQPQMSSCGRRLTGVEALLRWTSPTLGVVSPADFIPVAEQTGIIVDIDRWVIRAACAQAKAWQLAGIDVPRVAVNVSGVSFRRGQLIAWIDEALANAQLPAGNLEIELTEGVLMHDATLVIETLASLRKVGVRIALDDFGTGYSSLGYLKRFKLDVLKIDRSFISGLPDDPDSVAIARLIVAMAKTLRLETVAEGVETREQAMFLEGLGCDTLQGFLFSRAVPAAEVGRFADGAYVDGHAGDAARLPARP